MREKEQGTGWVGKWGEYERALGRKKNVTKTYCFKEFLNSNNKGVSNECFHITVVLMMWAAPFLTLGGLSIGHTAHDLPSLSVSLSLEHDCSPRSVESDEDPGY